MKLLIVEDEINIANYIEKLILEIPVVSEPNIVKISNLDEGLNYLETTQIDVLLLDLNLRGKDGFDLLKLVSSGSFHTIVISAYKERAIEAFEYGVLDFVPKPFNKDRLEKAFQRIESKASRQEHPVKYFGVRKGSKVRLIDETEVLFFEACEHFSKIHLRNGVIEIHDKSLARLTPLLSGPYYRIHKSYLVKLSEIEALDVKPGGKYSAKLKSGNKLPVGRSKYKALATLIV